MVITLLELYDTYQKHKTHNCSPYALLDLNTLCQPCRKFGLQIENSKFSHEEWVAFAGYGNDYDDCKVY